MKIELDVKYKKMMLTVAKAKGVIDLDVVGEALTGESLREQILNSMRKQGLKGTVYFDGKRVDL